MQNMEMRVRSMTTVSRPFGFRKNRIDFFVVSFQERTSEKRCTDNYFVNHLFHVASEARCIVGQKKERRRRKIKMRLAKPKTQICFTDSKTETKRSGDDDGEEVFIAFRPKFFCCSQFHLSFISSSTNKTFLWRRKWKNEKEDHVFQATLTRFLTTFLPFRGMKT